MNDVAVAELDRLVATLRDVVEEHGYRAVITDVDGPELQDITVKPPPGDARMREFMSMAVDRLSANVE